MRKELVWIVAAGVAVGVLAVILVSLGNPPNMGFCVACFERDIAGAIGLHRPWQAAWMRRAASCWLISWSRACPTRFRRFNPVTSANRTLR